MDLTGPVNIGNPKEFTMIELAQLTLKLTGSRARLVHAALPQDDPRQRQPDISIARRALNWEPRVELEEGLTRTIAYYQALN